MGDLIYLRLIRHLSPAASSATYFRSCLNLCGIGSCHNRCYSSNTVDSLKEAKTQKNDAKWLTLPPFTATINSSDLGKELSQCHHSQLKRAVSVTPTITALKWVLRCCPDLPRSLVQKLFRLRQVYCFVHSCLPLVV